MINILTYNIHKGFDRFNRDFVLHKIKDQLHEAEVDVVLLQEIQGRGLTTPMARTRFIARVITVTPYSAST
jgi:endonuclease/exonuclease/phosphatase family metal-dependent hydrolase